MNPWKLLIAIPAVGVVFAIGLFYYARFRTRNDADPEQLTTDPQLRKLQALNPGLRIVDEFARVPVYWIKWPGAKEGILLPKSETEDAHIRVHNCDASAIPPQLLYPNRTETACVEIENGKGKLSAYFFRSKDDMKKVVAFFEAPLDPVRRFGITSTVEERREDRHLDDGSKQFVFSYFLWERYDLVAFIGYREEFREKNDGQ